jgi:hypothetical protein
MAIGDTQQMNGYTYANNNPITLADPTGLLRTGEHCPDGDCSFLGSPAAKPSFNWEDNWACVDHCGSAADNWLRQLGGAATKPDDAPSLSKAVVENVLEAAQQYYSEQANRYCNPGSVSYAACRAQLGDPLYADDHPDNLCWCLREGGEEFLLELSGLADVLGCLNWDPTACGWLAAALIPWGKLTSIADIARNLPIKDPKLANQVADAIHRAANDKTRFPRHDGKVFENRANDLPAASRGYYRMWTVADAGEPRGVYRVIIGGNPDAPDIVYLWNKETFVRLAPSG